MIDAYLERIGLSYASINKLDAMETLSLLHSSHLYSIPFENLDIHLARPLRLETNALFEKIIQQRRGGFCYELNALFAEFLKALGLTTELISAQVFQGEDYTPEFDHLCLLVRIDQRHYLADVGFGDNFIEPIELRSHEIDDGAYQFRLAQIGDYWVLSRSQTGTEWQIMYRFKTRAHQLSEFEARCNYHQNNPESNFKKKVIASIARPNGRFSLSNDRQILRQALLKEEEAIPDAFTYAFLLEQAMGICLSEAELQTLWHIIKPD